MIYFMLKYSFRVGWIKHILKVPLPSRDSRRSRGCPA